MSATVNTVRMLSRSTTGSGNAFRPSSRFRTFQASVAGTGAVAATVVVEVTNESTPGDSTKVSSTAQWLTLGTITLSGTTNVSDGFESRAAWAFARMRLTAVSGTNAAVIGTMGVQQ